MNRSALAALLAGALPILAVHAAYLVNIGPAGTLAAEFVCMPYLDGCVSISRAARSGPGLYLFRWTMLLTAGLLVLCWLDLRPWLRDLSAGTQRRRDWIRVLGLVGAVFLVLYVTALGSEGEWYRWQRRYGVIFYFAGTGLAQLLLLWVLWPHRHSLADGRLRRPIGILAGLVGLQWALGVFSSVKRLLFRDPALIDRLENITEWWFALPMSVAFLLVAWMFLCNPPLRAPRP
jgi:hypothetical protein